MGVILAPGIVVTDDLGTKLRLSRFQFKSEKSNTKVKIFNSGLMKLIEGNFSLAFDGTNDRLVSNNTVGGAGLSTFTVMAWVRITANPTTNATAVSISDGTTGVNFYSAATSRNFGSNFGSSSPILTVDLDAWTHMTIKRDSANSIFMQKNGGASSSVGTNAAIIPAASTFNVGASRSGASTYNDFFSAGSTNSKIDEVRVYNIFLTDAQVNAEMNKELFMPYPPGLIFYMKLNDNKVLGTGASVAEEIVNNSESRNFSTATNVYSQDVPFQ